MKTYRNIVLSSLVIGSLAACTTSKTVVSNGEYDDMYGSSKDAAVAYAPAMAKNLDSYSPEYLQDYTDEYDRMPVDSTIEGTDAYYDENYVNSRNLKRSPTPGAGYSSGYADGYSEGWNDYAWNSPYGWNSGFNRWGSGFGYSPWGYSSFGMFGYVPLANRLMFSYGYSPWGYNSFYSPWGWNSMAYSPWGYGGGFGYSPWGYNSLAYNSFGYYGYGYGSFGNGWSPYYGVQPVYANNLLGTDTRYNGQRSYGPRANGRASSVYNGGFVNTRRPVASTAASSRRAGTSTIPGTRTVASTRANGNAAGNTSYRRPASYDSYARSNRGVSSSASPVRRSAGTTYTGRSSSPSTYSPSYSRGSSSSSSERAGTFSRSARSSSPSSSGYSGRSSGTYSSPSSRGDSAPRSSGYSRPSTPSSSGSYSRGSSSGGSYSGGSSSRGSSGGSSRGPR